MTLGPRVIKTGISITLALYICQLLGWGPAIFAAVAAIFTLQPSIYKSWRQMLDQLQTNTLGAVIAIIANHLFGNEPLAIGLIAILAIIVCLKMRMENTISLTLVTVLAVMSAPTDEDIWYAVNRFLLILIGMGAAFAVNVAILRPKHGKLFMDKVEVISDRISVLLRTTISGEMTERAFKDRMDKLNQDMEQLEELYHMFDEERRKFARLRKIDQHEFDVIRQMLETLKKGKDVLQTIEEHYVKEAYTDEIHLAFDRHLEYLTRVHEHILLGIEGDIRDGALREEETLRENGAFLKRVMDAYEGDASSRLGLILTGSAIFEYGFQLHRLERLVMAKPLKLD